jgi:glutamate racemase
LGKESPIGIFDSGVGGLTVVKSLLERLPGENFIYFGDNANVPYGNKTQEQLMTYAVNILNFFKAREVKAVMVACGTHSSVTLPQLQGHYHFPMLGVLKAGARSATQVSKNHRVGVLATEATVNSRAYTREIKAIKAEYQVFEMACQRFVPLIESGVLSGEEINHAVREYVTPLLDNGIDTLVLGCTHYPFLSQPLKEFVGRDVELVDPSLETIEELKELLIQNDLLNNAGREPRREFYVSGHPEPFFNAWARWLMAFLMLAGNSPKLSS